MGVGKTLRYVTGSTILFISQSFLFGLAVLPALLFWQFVAETTRGVEFLDPYGRYILISTSLIPAYALFAITLMFSSAGFNRLMGWRTTEGEYSIHDANWKLVRWGSYNASIQLVRVFCGEVMRTTPLWTMYLKANGATIGKGCYVNSARLFDHNLLILKDKAVIGGDAKLVAHLVERGRVIATPVVLGKNAVIGINTVIGPGVEVGDNSAVGAMSFVPKYTKIPANEAWGGVPARRIKGYEEGEFERKGQPGIPVAY